LGLPEERTTVTKKVRRVGGWDADLVAAAVAANGGFRSVRLALTMLDQKFPEVERLISKDALFSKHAPEEITHFIKQVEVDAGAPVKMVTTSPRTAVWL
jgi:adenylosuccinate synthase